MFLQEGSVFLEAFGPGGFLWRCFVVVCLDAPRGVVKATLVWSIEPGATLDLEGPFGLIFGCTIKPTDRTVKPKQQRTEFGTATLVRPRSKTQKKPLM